MAENCPPIGNYAGKQVIVAFIKGCGNLDPQDPGNTYLPIGSMNQKDFTIGTTLAGNTSDDTFGVDSNIVTLLTSEITASGYATQSDSVTSNQTALKKYIVDEVMADQQRQPTVWVEVSMPDLIYYVFCNLTETSVSGATADVTTFSVTFSVTATGSLQKPIQYADPV